MRCNGTIIVTMAAAASSPALPADPATFAACLAAAGAQDRGYAQTKTRCVAISALCALVGAPSPEAHHLVRAYRTAARRNKRFRRGSVTPLFRSELPLPPTEPPQGAPQLARRAGLSPDERLRQRAATARHMALMHDAALRFDDTKGRLAYGENAIKRAKDSNYSCEICGENDVRCLEIDHKDGDRKNTSYDNLQCLCGSCHNKKTRLERLKHRFAELNDTELLKKLNLRDRS